MAEISMMFNTDKLMGMNLNKSGKYNYMSFTTKEENVYKTCSVEWEDGAVVPDAVMDIVNMIKPGEGKATASVAVSKECEELYARLADVLKANSDGR